jgi:hypothetical protein
MKMFTLLLTLFSLSLSVNACVDNCMAYGASILNTYPYNSNTLFYLPVNFDGCKQCYFAVTVGPSNPISAGLYNPSNGSIAIATSSDTSLKTGFTTCSEGYCMILLDRTKSYNTITMQVVPSTYSGETCFFNNSYCGDSGIVSTQMKYVIPADPQPGSLGCVIKQ